MYVYVRKYLRVDPSGLATCSRMNLYVWGLAIFAAFGGFMFGYDIGVINGVKEMEGFQMTFNLTMENASQQCSSSESSSDFEDSTILGLIVSIFSIGCLLGALLAGALSEKIGRKPAIMIGGIIFIVGGALQGAAFFIWMIMLGRITAGVGVGILSMVVPVYNAEVSPKALRGRLVSLNQLAITAGIMVSFITAVWTKLFIVGWRVALGLQCVLGVILILGMLYLPETPRWLVKKHKDERALQVLIRLRRVDAEKVQEELTDIQTSVKQSETEGGRKFTAWRALLTWQISQRVLIGVFLQLFQQFTGMNVIMYYSTFIFGRIGVEEYVSTAIVGTINFLVTFLAIFLVDKVGRKSLLLLGGVGMLLSMLSAATLIKAFGIEDCSSETIGTIGYVVVFFVCFFVFNFAYSWGPIAWVVTSEIFPLHVRGVAVSITTAANWVGNFVIAMLTPILIASPLGIYGTFYILCGFLFLAILFVLMTLPETKGESLERIDTLFAMPWLQRINILYYIRCGCPWQCKQQSGSYRPNERQETESSYPNLQAKLSEDQALLLHKEDEDSIVFSETEQCSSH